MQGTVKMFDPATNEGIGEFGLRSMFVAFIGAVVLLAIVGLLTGRRGHSPGGYRRR